MKKKEYREDYEYSSFYKFLWTEDSYISMKGLYKKVDKEIILNPDLTFSDLAIYLSILMRSSFKNGYRQLISSGDIFEICGIIQNNQTRSIKKLEVNGYIKVYRRRYESRFTINLYPNKYIPLTMDQFEGLKDNVKDYIRRLRGLVLSNGNNAIPSYNTSKTKFNGRLSREEYYKIKKLYNLQDCTDEIDIGNYLRL